MHDAWWWLILNIATVVLMGYFSMIEMACVSFNRVRLQYYVHKGHRRAIWLHWMMQNPSRLFGTTLIGVNVTMMIGSECARQFYEALGYVPEIAPLTQVLLVVTFGELAPMFAARRHPEHVAMLGMPLLYTTSRVLKPVLIAIDWLTGWLSRLFGIPTSTAHKIFMTREELQTILEETDDVALPASGTEDLNLIVAHIFSLREKNASQLMEPIRPIQMLSSSASVGHMRHIMRNSELPYLPLYHRRPNNIIGIAFPRDLIRVPDEALVRRYARPPWFISRDTPITQVLTQFRRNNQTLAVVLDRQGLAQGFLTLDAILSDIFGRFEAKIAEALHSREHARVVERTISGDMATTEFAKEFAVDLEGLSTDTVSSLMTKVLGHIPDTGEFIQLGPLKLTVRETSLTGAKTIDVTSTPA